MKTRKLDVLITKPDGEVIFEKKQVEAPEFWSDRAITIIASRYLTNDETSILQMIDRVVNQITTWGIEQGYFTGECLPNTNLPTEASDFSIKLYDILVNQRAAFNSPIYFNLGVPNQPQMSSACFIGNVEDTMEDILDHFKRAGMIFRSGSGIGVNVSKLRAKGEALSNKGTSSGPLSFMRAWDRSASAIKSGGKNRRSAILIGMDADHPDIEEFITCKSIEEDKINKLIQAGISQEEAQATVDFQNANHSVVVTDAFMKAVEEDQDWNLINRGDKKIAKTLKARELFDKIIKQAWATGDPGLQFTDTINRYNPIKNTGRIEISNPCLTGDMEILTAHGYIPVKELIDRKVDLITIDKLISTGKVWSNGIKKVIKLTLDCGTILKCTPDHLWMTEDGSSIPAQELLNKKLMPQCMKLLSSPSEVIKIEDAGEEEVFDFSEPVTHWGIVEGFIAHNCSEVYLPKWGCCQLASFNLPKYIEDRQTSYMQLEEDVGIITTALDIILGGADYPTEDFKREAIETRPLGIGATDLGGYLIKLGLPYNSREGRDEAALIIGLITLNAIKTSEFLAEKLGPFKRWQEESISCTEHYRRLLFNIGLPDKTISSAIDLINIHGIRNCCVSALAPTGTISLMLDTDCYGIEPLYSRETIKQLSDGSTMVLKPKCVEEATNSKAIVTADEIHWKDHIKMVATLQSVVSMGISKTANMPNSATVEDVEEAYMMAWRWGLKGITIYRDGSKALQPLTAKKSIPEPRQEQQQEEDSWMAYRRKLPDPCRSLTKKFDIGGLEGYFTAGMYDNGNLGQLFIEATKQGSTFNGLLDAFGIAVSLALQYGVPLEKLAEKFIGTRFEPNGFIVDEDIRFTTSVMDYIFRWLKMNFIDELDDFDPEPEEPETKQITPKDVSFDGPPCSSCGAITTRSGTCFLCISCGSTSSCS